MSGRPPGVACLIMVSTTLASLLLVPGVALSLEVGEQAPDFSFAGSSTCSLNSTCVTTPQRE